MLRTMMVDEAHRRRGLGRTLLDVYARYVDALGVRDIFCLPFAPLGDFYGTIGFRRVPSEDAPPFLRARLNRYRLHGDSSICMRRP